MSKKKKGGRRPPSSDSFMSDDPKLNPDAAFAPAPIPQIDPKLNPEAFAYNKANFTKSNGRLESKSVANNQAVVGKDKRIVWDFKIYDPKTYFANERTFLSWVKINMTLVTLGIGMITFTNGQDPFALLAGSVFSGIAGLFMIYALVIFRLRARGIKRRKSAPYDDGCGGPLFVIVLLGSLGTMVGLVYFGLSELPGADSIV